MFSVFLFNPAIAQTLPSGQQVALVDSLLEPSESGEGYSLVLRYLAPRIARSAGDLAYDDVVGDFDFLCGSDGLQAMSLAGQTVDQIVIVLMDRAIERGIPDPQATQLIGAYTPSDKGCIWQ